MNGQRFFNVVLAVSLIVAPVASGQDDQAPSQSLAGLEQEYQVFSAKLAKGVPERHLTVKTGPLQKIKLTRPDPKLLESKFIATFALRPAGLDVKDERSYQAFQQRVSYLTEPPLGGRDVPEALRSKGLPLVYVFHPQATPRESSALLKHFQWLAERCAPDSRPNEEQVAFLSSTESERTVRRVRRPGPGGGIEYDAEFQIQAPTAEEAEARAKAIIRLYDAGFSLPIQQYLLGECQQMIEAARVEYAKLAPLDAEIAAQKEELSKPSEISSDILKELKAQKIMVAVELAGLNARVKACDAMLQDPVKLGANALQSVGDMKVKAEIERVGIKEKLDAINGFIAEGDARDAALQKSGKLWTKRNNQFEHAERAAESVRRYIDLLKLFEPFDIPDNQITVAPLEWTE